eukprot:PhM_4_TR17566/c0_g1_i1/m.103844/K21988/TMC; transmembrane channel-like protein
MATLHQQETSASTFIEAHSSASYQNIDFVQTLASTTQRHNSSKTQSGGELSATLLRVLDALAYLYVRTRDTFARYVPMYRIMHSAEQSYGSVVATYFYFVNDIITLNIFLAIVWVAVVIAPWWHNNLNNNVVDDHDHVPMDSKELALNFLGANSPRDNDSTFFYYSGYHAAMPKVKGYDMGVVYSVMIVGTFGFSLLYILHKVRDSIMSATSQVQAMAEYQLPRVLYSWDWGVSDPDTIQSNRIGTISMLKGELVEVNIREAARKMESGEGLWTEKRKYRLRRTFGAIASTVLLGISLTIMTFIVNNESTLNVSFPHTSALLISLINLLAPSLQQFIVRQEGILDPAEQIRQEVLRIFFIKMMNIVFLVFQSDAANSQYRCAEFVLGGLYIQVLVTEMVVNFLSTIFTEHFFLYVVQKGEKDEFVVSLNVIDCFYRQCITWIGCAYSPMIFCYATVSNFTIAMVKYFVMKRVNCPPKKPVNMGSSSSLYRSLLLISLIFAAVPTFFFLQKTMSCGPHTNTTPMLALTDAVSASSIGPAMYWVFHPIVLFCVSILAIVIAYFSSVIAYAKTVELDITTSELDAEVTLLRELLRADNQEDEKRDKLLEKMATSHGVHADAKRRAVGRIVAQKKHITSSIAAVGKQFAMNHNNTPVRYSELVKRLRAARPEAFDIAHPIDSSRRNHQSRAEGNNKQEEDDDVVMLLRPVADLINVSQLVGNSNNNGSSDSAWNQRQQASHVDELPGTVSTSTTESKKDM